MDASPTKAWLVEHRNEPEWKRFFDFAFAKRPREELYVFANDPHQINNVADDPQYATIRESMNQRLMDELKRTGDPRVIDDGKFFETPPMAGPLPQTRKGRRRRRSRELTTLLPGGIRRGGLECDGAHDPAKWQPPAVGGGGFPRDDTADPRVESATPRLTACSPGKGWKKD